MESYPERKPDRDGQDDRSVDGHKPCERPFAAGCPPVAKWQIERQCEQRKHPGIMKSMHAIQIRRLRPVCQHGAGGGDETVDIVVTVGGGNECDFKL